MSKKYFLPLLFFILSCEKKEAKEKTIVYDLKAGYLAFVDDTLKNQDSLAREQAIYLAKNYGEDGISLHAAGIKKWLKNKGLSYDSIHQEAIAALHKNDKLHSSNSFSEKNSAESYDKIHIAFEGMPAIDKVKPLLEAVMKKYGMPITDSNINGCANVLVLQKNESKIGVMEMEILKHMYQHGDPKNTFGEQAVYSALYLEATK